MSRLKKYLVATFLSGAMFCVSIMQGQAMEIPTFDHMSQQDQADYVLYLVSGAKTYLESHGDAADGQKVRDYFISSNGGAGTGVDEFLKNLAVARLVNQQNANDPSKTPLQVEHAFALTLKHDGIIIPLNDVLAMGQGFQPSSPPSSASVVANTPPPTPPVPQ